MNPSEPTGQQPERIPVYGENGALKIRLEHLFALKSVQETIERASHIKSAAAVQRITDLEQRISSLEKKVIDLDDWVTRQFNQD